MLKLLNNDRLIVGYDLRDSYSQISYCILDSDNVETLSMVAGEEDYNIPTVLCKREGVNQWFCGREALRYNAENGGILVENLLSLAMDGEPVQIEGNGFDPVSLLTLFLKRSLGMLSQVASPDRINGMMITCRQMDHRRLEVLKQAAAGLRLKTDKIFFQSYTESFYHYMLYQPAELWREGAALMEHCGDHVKVYSMECNKRTSPVVVYINETEYPVIGCGVAADNAAGGFGRDTGEDAGENVTNGSGKDAAGGAAGSLSREEDMQIRFEVMDGEMLSISRKVCEGNPVSGIYLIGEQFSGEWMKESLRYLCRGRRVFQGNNLYSKGACFGVMERIKPGEAGKKHAFLGNDKLKANVGMKILHQGEEIYFALLDAGVNWYEAENTFDFYMQDGNRVEFVITSLIGRNNKLAEIILEDLPGDLSRLRARLSLNDENHVLVEIEDLGLGVFRQATHHIWKEEIEL